MTDEELLDQMEEKPGFFKNNQYHVKEVIKKEKVVLEADITENALNPYGFAHGGFIFGLGDTAMGIAARSTGRNAVTLSSSITYLRPSTGKKLKAIAELVKDGKKTCYLKCNFYNEEEKLTASMDASYYYVD